MSTSEIEYRDLYEREQADRRNESLRTTLSILDTIRAMKATCSQMLNPVQHD